MVEQGNIVYKDEEISKRVKVELVEEEKESLLYDERPHEIREEVKMEEETESPPTIEQ